MFIREGKRGWGLGEKVKGLGTKTHNSAVITRGEGAWEVVGKGKGGINGDGRRLDLRW